MRQLMAACQKLPLLTILAHVRRIASPDKKVAGQCGQHATYLNKAFAIKYTM